MAGRLGHRHIDHHDQVEGVERLAHAVAVGEGVGRVRALDEHGTEAIRVIGEDLVGDRVGRDEAGDDPSPGHRCGPLGPGVRCSLGRHDHAVDRRRRGPSSARARATERRHLRVDVHRARTPEVAREQVEHLLQVRVERAVRRHAGCRGPRRSTRWTHGRCGAPRRGHRLRPRRLERSSRRSSTRPRASSSGSSLPACASRDERTVDQVLLDEHGQPSRARQNASVPGRTCRWMSARSARLGAARVDHDERPLRVVGDGLEDRAGAREAVRLPRVLADEHRHLGVLVVAGRVAPRTTEQLAVDPELTRLLLGERVRAVDAARARRGSLRRTRRRGGSPVPHRRSRRSTSRRAPRLIATGTCRDLRDRRVPVDLLEGPVLTATERRGQPAVLVLVVVEAQRLLARVALRSGMRLVAADPLEATPVEPHLDPAVDAAQDAGGLVPLVAHAMSPRQ